jgi:hypothetical protein
MCVTSPAKVEQHAKGDDRLDLEPAQMAEYLEGARVLRARQLLEESAGRQLSRAELTDIRNCLALQILLANAKRAGDVTVINFISCMPMISGSLRAFWLPPPRYS